MDVFASNNCYFQVDPLPDGESVKFRKNKRDMRTPNRWYGKPRQRILGRARDD